VNPRKYVQTVLHEYRSLPDTPDRPRKNDRVLALELNAQRVPLEIVIAALRLASLRRRQRPASAPPLDPIRSLFYFVPVIEELQRQNADPFYLAYVSRQYEAISQNEPPSPKDHGGRRAIHQLSAVWDRR